jgi:Excalibur calcium-binding domain
MLNWFYKQKRSTRQLYTLTLIAVFCMLCFCCSLFAIPADETESIAPPENKTALSTQDSEIKGLKTEEVEPITPKCEAEKGNEVSRKCTECKKAEIEVKNADCTTTKKMVEDNSCTSQCPKVETPQTKAKTYTPPAPTYTPPAASYTCNCSKTCTQITTCAEAYFQLNKCGCSRRDGDNDGIPCDQMCQ